MGEKNSLIFSQTKNYISFIKNGNKKLKTVKFKRIKWVKLASIYSLFYLLQLFTFILLKKLSCGGKIYFFMGQKKYLFNIFK